MPEGLATADGFTLDLDDSERAFAAAMAAPPADDPEHPAPPRREPVDPEAPFGRKVDGTPKKARGGRPPKPRVQEAPAGAGKPAAGLKAVPPVRDFSAPLAEFVQGVWMAAAATPVPWPELRTKVRAQAYLLKANAGGIVQGVNTMAQHNAMIRRGVEVLTTGSAGWVLPAMFALTPFVAQTAALWRSPLTEAAEQMAAATEAEWEAAVTEIKAEMGMDQEQVPAAA